MAGETVESETINSEKSRGDRQEQNDQVERELREQTVDNNRLSMSRFGQKSTCPPRKKFPYAYGAVRINVVGKYAVRNC